MANLKGCFSHKTDDWQTPKWFPKLYRRKEFQIDFFEGRLHFNESKNLLHFLQF